MYIKKILPFFFFILSFLSIQAQKESWHWYFGEYAGLDFSSGSPVADTNGKTAISSCTSSVSDTAGMLLFYSNSLTVWNKNHLVMDNGTGLSGLFGGLQPCISIKQPGNDSIYYLFITNGNFYGDGDFSFRYSIVNTHQNSGLGKVMQKNVFITDSTKGVAAIRHCNGKDVWIVVANFKNNNYLSYLLSNTGLSVVPVSSSIGITNMAGSYKCLPNYIKASPNGKKIAVTWGVYSLCYTQLSDFDNSTGMLSNPLLITKSNPPFSDIGVCGIEFSPGQKYLYISYGAPHSPDYIYQYDISSNDSAIIDQSAVEIYASVLVAPFTYTGKVGVPQLASDKKIYFSFPNYTYIGVVNYPDSAGLACGFIKNGVFLNGKICRTGLPNFYSGIFTPSSDFAYTQKCLKLVFSPLCNSIVMDSLKWNFGDIGSGVQNTSSQYNPVHIFTDTGSYTIKVIYYHCNIKDTIIKTINVQLPVYSFPPAYIKDTLTSICKQIKFIPVCDSAALDSLRWNFGDPVSGANNTANWYNPYHKFSDTGTYQVSLILYAYCRTDTIQKTIHIAFPINGVYLGNDTSLCSGAILQLGGVIPCPLTLSYLWQDGAFAPGCIVTHAGTYWQKVNAGGCLFSDTITISYLEPPTISLPIDTVICEDNRIDVRIPQGNYSLLWDNGSTFFNRSFTHSGNYWLTATNFCGTATDAFVLQTKNCNCYLYFPNAFTPDGNDLNACFAAVYDCGFETWHLYIYNRWGQLLFETKNPTECWDGKYKNKAVFPDVYVWVVEYKSATDGEIIGRKGVVTVLN